MSFQYKYLAEIYDEVKSVFWQNQSYKIRKYIQTDSKVLDLGSGTGLAIEFLNILPENYTGIELSNDMLQLAKAKYPEYVFINDSIIDINLDTKYDLIICCFDTINHLLKKDEWEKTFEIVRRHMKASSVFVFDIVSQFDHRFNWPNQVSITESDLWIYIQKSEFLTEQNKAVLSSIIFKKNMFRWDKFEEKIEQISFSVRQIKTMLKRSNLSPSEIIDFSTNETYTKKSAQIQFICKLNN